MTAQFLRVFGVHCDFPEAKSSIANFSHLEPCSSRPETLESSLTFPLFFFTFITSSPPFTKHSSLKFFPAVSPVSSPQSPLGPQFLQSPPSRLFHLSDMGHSCHSLLCSDLRLISSALTSPKCTHTHTPCLSQASFREMRESFIQGHTARRWQSEISPSGFLRKHFLIHAL